jgi:uncharacterized protein (UPF0276 family)
MRYAVANSVPSNCHSPRAGVGLRLPHLVEVAAAPAAVSWLEVHPENFIANPHARELLQEIAKHRAISLHTVGLSIGSASGIDRDHLARVRMLVDDVEPMLVSGHLAWSTHGELYLNDLLPLPYDDEALRIAVRHVDEIQDALERPYLIENPASYVIFDTSTISEIDFLSELVKRTGCRLLCDVSNVFVSAANLGYDPYDYIDAFPAHDVAEIHLGGYTREADESDDVLIDTHDSAISESVWPLYAHALQRFGPRPTLIEWDNKLPPFRSLVIEADRANAVAADVFRERFHAASVA